MSEQNRYRIILIITFLGLAGLLFFGIVALINPWSHLIDPQNVISDMHDRPATGILPPLVIGAILLVSGRYLIRTKYGEKR